MEFIKQKINNLYLIKLESFKDVRGNFKRLFCQKEFKKHNIINKILQINLSFNKTKNTLRGLHYQKGIYAEEKIIRCMKGKVFFIALDIDKKSPTYLKHKQFILKENDNKILYIGKKFATGFLTMQDSTEILYFMSNFYKSSSSFGFKYDDPKLKIKWPSKPKVISSKDSNFKFI